MAWSGHNEAEADIIRADFTPYSGLKSWVELERCSHNILGHQRSAIDEGIAKERDFFKKRCNGVCGPVYSLEEDLSRAQGPKRDSQRHPCRPCGLVASDRRLLRPWSPPTFFGHTNKVRRWQLQSIETLKALCPPSLSWRSYQPQASKGKQK